MYKNKDFRAILSRGVRLISRRGSSGTSGRTQSCTSLPSPAAATGQSSLRVPRLGRSLEHKDAEAF